jgi:hypothetical protein
MIKRIFSFILLVILTSHCKIPNTINKKNMRAIDLFKTYITGDYDNTQQVADEKKAGKQIHPLAKHVNRIANSKIKNLPDTLNGFFLIEESYYTYEGKPTEIKPFLFFFEDFEADKVRLHVYQLPKDLPKEQVTNANKDLFFDYKTLQPSPTFGKAIYQFSNGDTFTTNSPNELPNKMRFTLIEKFTPNRLEVMELLEKDGKRLTPYDTPIIYNRLK